MTALTLEDFRIVEHKPRDTPCLLAHLMPAETGLPVTVWLSCAGGERGDGRIPVRIAGPQDQASMEHLHNGVEGHKVTIRDYWQQKIGTVELMHALDLFRT